MKNSEVLDVKPGQSIGCPVEAKGRSQPVEINKWIGRHPVNVPNEREFNDAVAAVRMGKKK